MPSPSRESSAARFAHDCERCTFLGRHGAHDVYVCPQFGWPTVVLRFGDAGRDYYSGAHLVSRLPESMQDRATALMGG